MAKETTIVTDVLAPEREYVAEYTAHNPAKLLGVMLETMKQVWRISSAAVFADKIKWDVTGDKIDFYGEWRARLGFDKRTTVWNKIIAQGMQDAKTKEGVVTIRIKPTMETKIESATSLDLALKTAYLNNFYKEQMMKYVAGAKRRVNDFDEAMREILEIGERTGPTKGAGKL